MTLLASPIIARLFSPDSFGIVGLFLSIVGIVAVNSTFRYHSAIILPEKDKEAVALTGISFLATFLVSCAIGLIIFLLKDVILMRVDFSVGILIIIPVAIFFNGCIFVIRNWQIRKKSYGRAAIGEATQTFGSLSAQLLFGFLGYVSGLYLVFSYLIGVVISFIVYWKSITEKSVLFSKSLFDRALIKEQLHKYKKFPQYSTLSGVINKLAWELPSFMLIGFFSPTILGYYVLGHRILRMPISLIGKAIGEVYFERGAKAYSENKLSDITILVQRRLVQIGFFPFFVLSFTGESIFTSLFGTQWAEAGYYTQLLAIWTFVWFITSPNTTVYAITNNQNKLLNMQVILFTLRFSGLLIGGLIGSPRLSILLFGIAGIVGYSLLLIQISNLINISKFITLKEILKYWPAYLLFVLIIVPLIIIEFNSWGITSLSIVSVLVYYLYIFKKEEELKTMVSRLF